MTGTPPPGQTRAQTRITVPDPKIMVNLLGAGDEILRLIERSITSDVHVRGNEITLTGAPGDNAFAERLFTELLELIEKGETLTTDAVRRTLGMIEQGATERPAEVLTLNILSRRGRTIRPKTLGQKRYVDAIDQNTIIFGIGPAGTGKTYLAMAKAVQALQAKQVNRIILTRPAVEAGERLGFLPGTLSEKIDPYLRPLYDALHDMLDPESIPKLMAAGTIEVAPLAYMRGRAQPYDARVLTPEGFKPFGSLRIGDLVIGSDGTPTPVIGIYPQGPKQVYRVTTQDGASTVCCGEHLWTVVTPEDRRRGRRRTLETREMMGLERQGPTHRYELPVVAPVQLEPAEVPLDPYALGLLLGNGAISGRIPEVATADLARVGAGADAFADLALAGTSTVDGPRRGDGHRGGVLVANPATVALRELNLVGTVFVPEVYQRNSVDVRLAVLQGLLDTDAGSARQVGRTCRVRFTTTSTRLRDDVVYLVQSLGGIAYQRAPEAEGGEPRLVDGRPVPSDAHVLDIRLPDGVPPFRLSQKRRLYEQHGGGRPRRFVDSIVPAGVQETMCIQVAAEDSLYVTDDFLVTHNTLNDAFIILDEAQNTTPEQMKMFLTRLGFGSKIVVTGDITQVDLPGGTTSGLHAIQQILAGVEDVHFAQLSSSDVVRHRLVSDIVDAYARWDAERESQQQGQGVHAVPGRAAHGGRAGRRR
ncbi:PhoH family protein [Micromonospora sp. HM5-17]|uniref:PhoH family protein n=1 Tax=Micromonospora sp. HM5-17 TaxID=2487710 RepID=UPI000F488860|nr:phosphate starvation-inducible protein PhoH [Micromonospora sp. HM5-17]